MRAVLVAAIVLGPVLDGGCVAASGGAIAFPARYEVAPVSSSSRAATSRGVHYAAGLSWASWRPETKNSVDGVLGYAVDDFASPAAASGPVPASSSATNTEPTGDYLVHGPFLELAGRIAGNSWQRLWLGGRTQILFDNRPEREGASVGLGARLGWELFHGLRESTRNAGVEGVLAIGLFAEAGLRTGGPIEETELCTLGGVSVRLPGAGAR